MRQLRGDPVAIDLWVKRRPPVDRTLLGGGAAWVLLVAYRAEGNEHAARLPLSGDEVARKLERLVGEAGEGQRRAPLELFACLHHEWCRTSLGGRHPAWDAVFRYLAPLAAAAPVET